MLRVHRTGYHPPGAIASELAWLQALRADEGLLTPAVYAAADGREVVDIQSVTLTRQTVLFEWLPGTEPPGGPALAAKFELLGGICARMHRHSRGWRQARRLRQVLLGLRLLRRGARRAGAAGRTASASALRNWRRWPGPPP